MINQAARIVTLPTEQGNPVTMEYRGSLSSVAKLAKVYALSGYEDRYAVFSPLEKAVAKPDDLFPEKPQPALHLSLIMRPTAPANVLECLSHMATVALAEALEKYTEKPVFIGWKTRVYAERDLVGSVKTETKLGKNGEIDFILLHFDAKLDQTKFPLRMSDQMRAVFEGELSGRETMLAKDVLTNLYRYYTDVYDKEKYLDAYRKRFVMNGLAASMETKTGKSRCVLLATDAKAGFLRVENDKGGIITFSEETGLLLPDRLPRKCLRRHS